MTTEQETHEHDLGLAHDLPRLISRRRALGAIATGVGATALVACGSGGDSTSSATSSDAATTADAATTSDAVPEETAGPFPADGTNGPDVLAESGVVRSDLTGSIGSSGGVAEGVPTTLDLSLIDVAGGGGPLAGAAVYLWHCTREGAYSMYEEPVTGENFLRGVQVSDDEGKLSFSSIFPGCYAGRWPHMHFEIYESADAATAGTGKLRTSQLALPQDVCEAIYSEAEGYEQSTANLSQLSLESDMVFADGYASQVPTWTGSAGEGIALELNVNV